jgi:hypothetical protein
MNRTHELKTWPKYFQLVWRRRKLFEHRKNDRGFMQGDFLILREWMPRSKRYTGRSISARVDLVVADAPGLRDGYCIMQINPYEFLRGVAA